MAHTLTQEQADALNAVLEYNWSDERDDYADNPESREGHIFVSLVELENMLQGEDKTPDSYLTSEELEKADHEETMAGTVDLRDAKEVPHG